MGYVKRKIQYIGDLARRHGERSFKVGLVTKEGNRFVRIEDPVMSMPQDGAALPAGQQAVDTVDYKTLKAGESTPDGMYLVVVNQEAGRKWALLRTAFNRMSHFDAEAKAETGKSLGHRLPTIDELDMISDAMPENEVNALDGTVAWTRERNGTLIAHSMNLKNRNKHEHFRQNLNQVCLIQWIDLGPAP